MVSWFQGPDFATSVASPEEVTSEEAWLVCSACAPLVDVDDRDRLARRGAYRNRRPADSEKAVRIERAHHDTLFWTPRTCGRQGSL